MNIPAVASAIMTSFFIHCVSLTPAIATSDMKRLNDTGIHYGGDYPKGIRSSCTAEIKSGDIQLPPGDSFVQQQDCATGTSATNNNRAYKTFIYRKISPTGAKLPDHAEQWHCVLDEVSGLMWEVKQNDTTPDSPHSAGDRFTWYNSDPDINGGNIGDWNRHGAHCSGYDKNNPRSYCHVEQFVSRVNKRGLCGFYDWRLPTRDELTSLIHFGEFQPAIERDYFPNATNNFYWTLNPIAGRPIEAWTINFEFGYASPLRKTDPRPARLVRHTKQTQNDEH